MAKELGDTLVALLLVAVAGGLVCGLAWRAGRRPTVEVPHEPALISTGDAALAFFLWFLWQWLVFKALGNSPGLAWVYGHEPDQTIVGLWTAAISTPFAVLSLILVFSTIRGIRPAQLGLSASGAWSNVVRGYVAWLALMPPLLMMYFAISLLAPLERHPFELVGRPGAPFVDWVLFVLSAVVMAPLVEELLFRGVVFRWLSSGPIESHVGLAAAAVLWAALPLLEPETPVTPIEKATMLETYTEQAPKWAAPLLIVALCPGYAWLLYKSRRAARAGALNVLAAMYGSALLFAAMHGRVWPSPIPLFVFGLGLAWMAWRTGSLVAPMTMHALFNAVACVQVALKAGQ